MRLSFADLVVALPEMTSLSLHPDHRLSFKCDSLELAAEEFWLLSLLLGRSRLRHLDLR